MNGHPELRDHLAAYLAVREALGFKDAARTRMLKDFVEYVTGVNGRWPIDARLALDWACGPSSVRSPGGQACRLSTARRFLCYLKASIPETQIPDSGLLARPRRRRPYIFTQEEIVRILDAASAMRPQRTLRPQVYASMIGLLASTGMRAGEVIRLRIDDVLLEADPPYVTILETKFRNYAEFMAMPIRQRLDRDDACKEPSGRHSQVAWFSIVFMAKDPRNVAKFLSGRSGFVLLSRGFDISENGPPLRPSQKRA